MSPTQTILKPGAISRFVGGFTQTNGYIFASPSGWIGVDAPMDFAAWLEENGIRLHALLLTHAHFDHVYDAAEIARTHKCSIYAWEKSTSESRLEIYLFQMAGMKLEIEDYPVDVILSELKFVDVGGLQLDLAHVPGHSPDSVVFFDPLHQRLFSGDTLMQGTIGRTDFPGGGTSLLMQGIRDKILPMGDNVIVLSGHGEPTTVGDERGWIESGRF